MTADPLQESPGGQRLAQQVRVAKRRNRQGRAQGAQASGSRRDRLASFEAARKKEQRNRTIRLLVICGVLAMALLAYPVYLFVEDYQARNATLAALGTDVAAAGCDPVARTPATGNQEHVEVGTKVEYSETPPASGSHYDTPAPFVKHFYSDEPTGRRSGRWCTTSSTDTPWSGTATARPRTRSRAT